MNKDSKRAVIEGVALVAAVTVMTAATAGCSSGSESKDRSKRTTSITASKKTTPSPSPTGPTQHSLKGTAKWDDITVAIGKFRRGSTDEYGVPEDTDYVRFAVTLTNDSDDPFDLSNLHAACRTREVYDFTAALEGVPDIHVLPSKSGTWDLACAQSKRAKELQVEINPDPGENRTAIFSGNVG